MDIRMGRGVVKVVSVSRGESGRRTAKTVYTRERKKKQETPGLRSLEKAIRAASEGVRVFGSTYQERHEESNQKRSDGWIRDLLYNVYRSGQKASEKIRVYPLPVPFVDIYEEDDEDEDED